MTLIRDEILQARRDGAISRVLLPTQTASWWVTLVLGGVVAFGLIVAAALPMPRIERVSGTLETTTPLARVLAPRAGTVGTVLVEEGAAVERGQRLALIVVEQATAAGQLPSRAGVASVRARQTIAREQIELLRKQTAAEHARQQFRIEALAQDQARLKQQIALQADLVARGARAIERLREGVRAGSMALTDFEQHEQDQLARQLQLRDLEQRAATAQAEARQTQQQIRIGDYASAGQLSSLEAALAELDENDVAVQRDSQYALLAPIAGHVTNLQAATGAFVGDERPLMIIVPRDAALVARVYVPSRAMGEVSVGQSVSLAYDAFPLERFGTFRGEVADVARTVLGPGEVNAPIHLEEASFRVTVKLAAQNVRIGDQHYALLPGMAVGATLVLDRSTLLERLFAPLSRAWRARDA